MLEACSLTSNDYRYISRRMKEHKDCIARHAIDSGIDRGKPSSTPRQVNRFSWPAFCHQPLGFM